MTIVYRPHRPKRPPRRKAQPAAVTVPSIVTAKNPHHGDDPLPSASEALDEPFAAFPSWFLRIECDRCGKATMINEARCNQRQRALPLRDFLARMRHDGCGGRAGKVELLTGVDGVSSRPVRKIVLRAD